MALHVLFCNLSFGLQQCTKILLPSIRKLVLLQCYGLLNDILFSFEDGK